MTDYESKLKINHLSNILKIVDKICPLLNNIYKEEYYQKIKEQNKKIISLRCQNKKCNKVFIDSEDYEITKIKKENRRKRNNNKFKMNLKCKKCNYISIIKLE